MTRGCNNQPTRRFRLLAAMLAGFLPLSASAWNFTGHRLSACIAWEQLPPASREKVGMLLRAHPDYAHWTRKAKGDAIDRAAFIEASTWADRIRHDPRFHAADEPATRLLPGFPDMESHGDWHYVNRPLPDQVRATDDDEARGQLARRLVTLTRTLTAHGASATAFNAKVYALPWLIHLVADAHQPLHVVNAEAAWLAPLDDPKRLNPSAPRRRIVSLHALWDDLPGASNLSGNKLDSACRALAARYPRPAPSSPAQWIEESWQIAGQDGFPADYARQQRVGKPFYERAHELANQRIVSAGHRLAGVLRRLPLIVSVRRVPVRAGARRAPRSPGAC